MPHRTDIVQPHSQTCCSVCIGVYPCLLPSDASNWPNGNNLPDLIYVQLLVHHQWQDLLLSALPIRQVCRAVACCTSYVYKKSSTLVRYILRREEKRWWTLSCAKVRHFSESCKLFALFLPLFT